MPRVLITPGFREAWGKWIEHRRQIRHPLTEGSVEMQFKLLAEMGEDRAIAAIRYTIAMGWRGIREKEEPRSAQQTFGSYGVDTYTFTGIDKDSGDV